jgi:hypothetical protein
MCTRMLSLARNETHKDGFNMPVGTSTLTNKTFSVDQWKDFSMEVSNASNNKNGTVILANEEGKLYFKEDTLWDGFKRGLNKLFGDGSSAKKYTEAKCRGREIYFQMISKHFGDFTANGFDKARVCLPGETKKGMKTALTPRLVQNIEFQAATNQDHFKEYTNRKKSPVEDHLKNRTDLVDYNDKKLLAARPRKYIYTVPEISAKTNNEANEILEKPDNADNKHIKSPAVEIIGTSEFEKVAEEIGRCAASRIFGSLHLSTGIKNSDDINKDTFLRDGSELKTKLSRTDRENINRKKNEFLKYTEKIIVTEGIEYINKFNNIKNITDKAKRIEALEDLYKNYIKKGSVKEVNIDYRTRKDADKIMKNITESDETFKILEKIRHEVDTVLGGTASTFICLPKEEPPKEEPPKEKPKNFFSRIFSK